MAGKLDLCVEYQDRRFPIELKLRYSDATSELGAEQLAEYMDLLGCQEGWLLLFDRRKAVSWEEKLFWRTEEYAGNTMHVVGC
jgi:hypothetical protein